MACERGIRHDRDAADDLHFVNRPGHSEQPLRLR